MSKGLYDPWKDEFYSIIEALKQKVDFEYLDYTKHPISEDKSLWYDYEHLNYKGALRFTEEITVYLKGVDIQS